MPNDSLCNFSIFCSQLTVIEGGAHFENWVKEGVRRFLFRKGGCQKGQGSNAEQNVCMYVCMDV